MVATFVTFVLTLREFLLTPAIYKQQLTHEQASGLFWINCLASITVAALVASMAPVLAWFFDEPRLLAMTLVMSGGVLLNMLGMMHVGLLHRQMQFGAVTVIEIGAITVGVVVGVVAALLGAEYWALVYQQLAIWVWQSAAAWWLCKWRPARRARLGVRPRRRGALDARIREERGGLALIGYVGRNTDTVLVGYMFGAPVLGLYQKAYQWAMMPFWQIYIPMHFVAVSSFSRLQEDPQRYRLYVRTTLLGVFALTLPAIALLMVEADGVVLLLFGGQWTGAISLLRVLSVGTYFSAFALALNWLYLSEGRTAEQLRWAMISAPLTIVAVVVGMPWGAIGVARGFTMAAILLAGPAVWHCLRRSPVTGADFRDATSAHAAAASLASASLLWLLRRPIGTLPDMLQQVLVHGMIFAALYITFWLVLPGGRAELVGFPEATAHDASRARDGLNASEKNPAAFASCQTPSNAANGNARPSGCAWNGWRKHFR